LPRSAAFCAAVSPLLLAATTSTQVTVPSGSTFLLRTIAVVLSFHWK
jgi:hypothetical protein